MCQEILIEPSLRKVFEARAEIISQLYHFKA